MRIDTLSYKYRSQQSAAAMYQSLVSEQQKFFQSKDPKITQLQEGTVIHYEIFTKTERLPVPATLTITKLRPNECFQMQTEHTKGIILQTYHFSQETKTEVLYSERNTFDEMRDQFGFLFIGFFYKILYNHGIKKRMRYIEQLCQET